MTAYIISNPKQFFTDSSGAPLDAGYVYIGISGQNPETAPASVYWDDAMTIPAAQPIRTISGYPSRNGAAASIYTAESQFSVTVKDKSGRIVISDRAHKPFVSGGEIAGDIFFSHDETYDHGSIGYRLTQTFNITDEPYGALPGSENTINAAIEAIIADLSDDSEIYIPAGDFYIDDADGAERVANGLNAPGYSTPTLFTVQNLSYLKIGGPGRLIVNGSRNLNLFDFVNITSLDLDGLKIQGNRDANPADILFFGIAGDLIKVRGYGGSFTKRLRVHNCDLGRAPISALRVMRAVNDATITGNTFWENTSTIRFGEDVSGLAAGQRPRRFVFDGNIVSGTVADACVEVRYIAQDVSISNNQLRTYSGDDVFEYANDDAGTVGTPVHTQGISVRGGPAGRGHVRSVNIQGNTVRAISDGGYVARGVTLLDTAGYNFAEDCIIGQNDIEGLVVINGADNQVIGNRVLGNITKDDATGDVSIKSNRITVPPAITLSISGNSVANPTVITTTSNHNLMTGDTVRISGSNSTPTIDGDRVATVISPTTFRVSVNVTVAGTAGTVKHDYDTKAVYTAPGSYQANIEGNEIFSDADTTMITGSCDTQIIKGNTLNFTGSATGNLNTAIRSVTMDSADISGNTIVNSDGSGVVIASTNGSGSLVTIAGNQVVSAGNRGIQITSGVTAGSIRVRGNDVGSAANGPWLNQSAGASVYLNDDNSFPGLIGSDIGDASVTVTSGSSAEIILYNTPITAARTVTLSTTGATKYDKHRILRTAACTGAYNVNVGTGPLKALAAAGTWCDVMYDGSAWVLIGYGTL